MKAARVLWPAATLGVCIAIAGCEAITKGVTTVGVATGKISEQEAASINKTAVATSKAMEGFTPEQEYYLGRSIAATILNQYKPLDMSRANDYINELGQSLAMNSDKPDTFGGYHFLIMDTDEVNAIACPGGLILVSRGLLRCCKNEDALAAVLAHEVGHVQLAHGVNAIGKSRWKSAGMTAVLEAGKNLAGQQLADALNAFEDCINDITDKILNAGYGRKQEYQADKVAIDILKRVGYNPAGLKDMLEQMDRLVKTEDKKGFGKTHPAPKDRIAEIEPLLAGATEAPDAADRQRRFAKAMAGI